MMTSLLGGGSSKIEVVGYVPSGTRGTALTAHATPGTDGAYTQLIAATADDWYCFSIIHNHGNVAGTIGNGLLDIAIGAAGVEQIIVADLPYVAAAAIHRDSGASLCLPLHIAKGSRIAARIHRSTIASHPYNIMLVGQCGPIRSVPPFTRATTYGTVLANARGTVVDPGATAHTLGANTEIVASTTNPIRSLYLLAMKQDAAILATSVGSAIETYVGAAAAEQVLTPETLVWQANNTTDITNPFGYGIGPFFVDVPAGSRLSAKARASDNTAGGREGQLTILGLD